MRYVKIDNGVVVNAAIFDGAMPAGWDEIGSWMQSDDAQIGWNYSAGVFTAPPPNNPPEMTPIASVPYLYAVAQIAIADGEISGFAVDSKFAGGFPLDVGSYFMALSETLPDTNYLAKAYDGGLVRAFVSEENKFTDSFIITVTDFSGVPVDTSSLSLEIIRVS